MEEASDRQKLRRAFAALRKQGYTAKMNFMCCQTCALYALKDADAYVFTHGQDMEAFEGGGLTRTLYIAWGGSGKEIVQALEAQFPERVIWDGREETRIGIRPVL